MCTPLPPNQLKGPLARHFPYGKKAGKTHVSFEFSPQELERQSAELQQLRRAGSKEETRKNRYIPNAAVQNQTRGGFFVGFQVSNRLFFCLLYCLEMVIIRFGDMLGFL